MIKCVFQGTNDKVGITVNRVRWGLAHQLLVSVTHDLTTAKASSKSKQTSPFSQDYTESFSMESANGQA